MEASSWSLARRGEPREGRKPAKKKRVAGQARPRERGGRGRRAGDRDDLDAGVPAGGDQRVAGIGNQRHARVADQRDASARAQRGHQLCRARRFVVLVIAQPGRFDAVVRQQAGGVARVLARDQVHFAQHAQGAQRKVLQVAYGGPDDKELPLLPLPLLVLRQWPAPARIRRGGFSGPARSPWRGASPAPPAPSRPGRHVRQCCGRCSAPRFRVCPRSGARCGRSDRGRPAP